MDKNFYVCFKLNEVIANKLTNMAAGAGLGTELFLDTEQIELQKCVSWNKHLQNVYISITVTDLTWRDFQARREH